MSNLRRQAMDHRKKVENSKTVSRKAKARLEAATSSPIISAQNSRPTSRAASHAGDSRPGSQNGSVVGSRQGSRAASPSASPTRHHLSSGAPSDDSDELEDLPEISLGLDSVIDTMTDRDFFKGSSETRAQVLRTYANTLCQIGAEGDEGRVEEMLPVLIRTIHKDSGDSARHALRAIAATAIICEDLTSLFGDVRETVISSISESEATEVKVAAIHCFGATTYFGGAAYHQVEATMGFLLQIVQSDGEYVDATDNAEVVTAAIEEWSFLSTLLRPDETKYHQALESFADQLESSAPEVLLSAADSLALLAEQEYTPRPLDEWSRPTGSAAERAAAASSGDPDHDCEAALAPRFQPWAWQRTHSLFQGRDLPDARAQLKELAASSMRKTRKDVRKELHAVARDVLHALDHPWRGPRFSTALAGSGDAEGGGGGNRWLGHRLVKSGLVIDRWWKLHRYNAIRRILQGGIQVHLEDTASVKEALSDDLMPPSRFRKGGDDDDDDDELVQGRDTSFPDDEDSDEELSGRTKKLHV